MHENFDEYINDFNGICFYCGCPFDVRAKHEHHVEKRSTNPEKIHDPLNKCPLCWKCHKLAHDNKDFFNEIQRLWKNHIKTKHQEN